MNKQKLILFLTLFAYACSDNVKTNEIVEEKQGIIYDTIDTDLSKLRHNIRLSNYYYPIEISKIDFKRVKNAFTTKAEKYTVSKTLDGLKLIVTFKMTNPYNKEMVVPIPDYFYITADNLSSYTPDYTYSKSCRCDIDNGSTLTYKGKELENIYDERIESDYCLKFKSNEVKEFKVSFDNEVADNIIKLNFIGFAYDKNGTTYHIESGIEIDVKSKSILRQIKVYH